MTKEDMQVAYERILQERVDLVRIRHRTPEQEQRLLDLEALIAFSPTSNPIFERFMREFQTPEDASRITITLHPDRDVTRLEMVEQEAQAVRIRVVMRIV